MAVGATQMFPLELLGRVFGACSLFYAVFELIDFVTERLFVCDKWALLASVGNRDNATCHGAGNHIDYVFQEQPKVRNVLKPRSSLRNARSSVSSCFIANWGRRDRVSCRGDVACGLLTQTS